MADGTRNNERSDEQQGDGQLAYNTAGLAFGSSSVTADPSTSRARTQPSGPAVFWHPHGYQGDTDATAQGGHQPVDLSFAFDDAARLTGVPNLGPDRVMYQPPAPLGQPGYGPPGMDHSMQGYLDDTYNRGFQDGMNAVMSYNRMMGGFNVPPVFAPQPDAHYLRPGVAVTPMRRPDSLRTGDPVYLDRNTNPASGNPQGSNSVFPDHGRASPDDDVGTRDAAHDSRDASEDEEEDDEEDDESEAGTDTREEDEDEAPDEPATPSGRRPRTNCDRCRVMHIKCDLLVLPVGAKCCTNCQDSADRTAKKRCVLTQADGSTALGPARAYMVEKLRKAAEKAAEEVEDAEGDDGDAGGDDAEVDDDDAEGDDEEENSVMDEDDEGEDEDDEGDEDNDEDGMDEEEDDEGDEDNDEDVMDEEGDIENEESEDGEDETDDRHGGEESDLDDDDESEDET